MVELLHFSAAVFIIVRGDLLSVIILGDYVILVEVFRSELLQLLLLLELVVEVNFNAVFFLHCLFLLFSVLLVPLAPAVLAYIPIKQLYYLVLPLLQLFLPYYALL